MMPEQKLMQAVIVRALMDAMVANPARGAVPLESRRANSWIMSKGPDFCVICALGGLSPDFIRDSYVSGRIDGQRLRSAGVIEDRQRRQDRK